MTMATVESKTFDSKAAHYLKPTKGGTTPGTVMFLGLSGRIAGGPTGDAGCEVAWDAQCVYRRHRRHAGEIVEAAGAGQAELATQLDEWACTAEAAWLYAYDTVAMLNATQLAEELTGLGWELSRQFGTSARAMWVVLHKGKRVKARNDRTGPDGNPAQRVTWSHTLTITDGQALNIIAGGDVEACKLHAHALARPVLTLMDWWDREGLGRWSVTGAALGWTSYRSTLREKQVVIDHDPDIIAYERRAVYGGRRDVSVVGTPGAPQYAEMDFEGAYPTIAAECPLPCAYGGQIDPSNIDPKAFHNPSVGIIADVTIMTGEARWPCRIDGKVFYPVGTFRTTLAGPDLAEAWDKGVVVEVHEVHWYRMSRHMGSWGAWVKGLISSPIEVLPDPVRRAAKHWSRAVIGKFAQRGWSTKPWVGPPCDGWVIEETPILGKPHRVVTVGLDGVYYLSEADQRGDHERPAVLAFVEAHVRTRLSKLINGRYRHAVVQWDTDGLIVSLPRLSALAIDQGFTRSQFGREVADVDGLIEHWCEQSAPLVIRQKTVMDRIVLYGPQHVVSDSLVKLAGVPRGAVLVRPRVYRADVRPRLGKAGPDDPSGLGEVKSAEFTINGPYAAGWVLESGDVRPPETWVDDDGVNHLVPWHETRWARDGEQLGQLQALWATGLYTPPPTGLDPPARPPLDTDEHGDFPEADPWRTMEGTADTGDLRVGALQGRAELQRGCQTAEPDGQGPEHPAQSASVVAGRTAVPLRERRVRGAVVASGAAADALGP